MTRYVILFAFLSIHFTILSQDYHPTQLFVKFKETTSLDNIDYTAPKSLSNVPLSTLQKTFANFQVKSVIKTSKIKKEVFQRIYTLSVADSTKLNQLILELKKLPEIELVERVPVYQTFFTPNDLHPNQWHLPQINALQAWDISTGSTSITVAIVDDAIKTDHEDLQNNIWVNPGEIPNNGIDDDNNGYIDDVNGYDVADWDNDPRPPSFATNSVFTHGTHCAGIAAAVSNNGKGIASIGYSVKIIPVKTKYSSTSDNTLNAPYDGVEYAINAGARVISMSWGGGGYSSIFQSLFDYAHAQGIVIVAAAGNNSLSSPFYPAAYNYVISVGATDNTDHVAYFSNYGTTIDIMAPGVNIWSTLAGSPSSYGYLSGTSMACPLVAGSAALILSSQPTLPSSSLEDCIKNSADNINALNPSYIGLMGGGRINVYNALRYAASTIYADFTANNTTICGSASVTFTDLSSGSVTGWNWSFPGGIPSSSTLKNPVVSYPVNGTYNASLTAYNGTVSGSITKTAYITVYQPGATLSGNNTIVAGDITYLKIDFNGVAPFSFSVSDGSTIINQSNAYSNPYYLSVSPTSTKTYTLTAFSDNNCSGNFTGSAIITVTTVNGNNPTICPTTDGLVAYYSFDGNTNDMSGNGNNGTIMGMGVSLTTDRFGNPNSAYDFDLDIQGGILSPMGLRSIIGISMWFNASSLNQCIYSTFFLLDDDITLNSGDISMGYFYSCLFTEVSANDDLFVRVKNPGDDFSPPIPNVVSNDVWHHYYCSYDGENNKLKVYIDGQLVGQKDLTPNIVLNNNFLRLGRQTTLGGDPDKFLGKMDEIRIYNRVLSDCEIAKLYDCNNTCINSGTCIPTTGLIGSYLFNGNALDASPSSNNGTVVGAILTTDRFGNANSAYNFSGGTSANPRYIYFSNDQSKKVSGDQLAISVWIKITGDGINSGRIFLGGTANAQYGIYKEDASDDRIFLRPVLQGQGQNFGQVHTRNNLSRNAWHHIVTMYDGSKTTIYVDGILNNSTTGVSGLLATNTDTSVTGGETLAHSAYLASVFDGSIDEINIYNRVLSDCEIAKLYNCNNTCGLVASYPFCGNANDVSGNGNNGTVSGAILTTDRFGNTNSAYDFNGTSSYIHVSNSSSLNITTGATLSAWVKLRTKNNANQRIVNKITQGTEDGYLIDVGSYYPYTLRYLGGNQSSYQYISSNSITYDVWHHIAATDDGQFIKLYIDGALNASYTAQSSTINTNPLELLIGASSNFDVNYFVNGVIDDVKIYNRALSDTEITTLYNEPAPCPSPCTLSITGNNTGCLTQNSIYSLFPSNLNNINWTVTGGSFTRLSGNTISVNWTSPGSNMIIASETVCGITTSLGVNVTCCTNSNISISGSNTGCLKDSLGSNIYEIDGAPPYNFQWIVTGGTFRQIAPNAISVIWTSKGTNSISASQTICGINKTIYVFVSCCNASSTSILGSAIVCKDSSYFYQTANVSVSDVYNWTISGGTFSKLNNYSAKVVWNSIGNRSIYAYEGQCQTAASLDVTVNLCGNQPRTITGTNSGCYNSSLSYKVTNTSSSTAFAWIVIGGNYITNGNNSIIVNWTSIGQNFVNAIDLSSGQTYTFPVTINCCSNNVPPDALPPVSVDFSELNMICNTVGSIALIGGIPSGGFYWYKGIALSYLVVSNAGDYPLIYQYTDQYKCTNTVAGVLTVKLCTVPGPCDMAAPPCTCPGYICPPPFKIYTAITPNGDQINDYLVMDSLPPDLKITIMDRWGNEFYHNDHYSNNWDGRSSDGEKMPAGIYYYIVEFEPGKRRYTGTIAIIRD